MFYCAERQEPQAPRTMETPLAEDRWHVLLCRKTGASSAQKDGNTTCRRPLACSTAQNDKTSACKRATPRKMETLFSEAQLHVLLCRMTEAVGETRTFDVRIGCSTFGRRVFLWETLRENTIFDWGRKSDAIFDVSK